MQAIRGAWLILALAGSVAAHAGTPGQFHLLEPVRDAAGQPLSLRGPDGRLLPVARPATGAAAARMLAILDTGVAAQLPALDAQVRASSSHRVRCPALDGGIAVYLSDEDGGFARKDLFIETQPGQRSLCADHFIDVTADSASLDSGEFEEVVAHEYGHVLLRRLLGQIPPTPSRSPHGVAAITDPVTAFDEGFGIHWQPLAARLTTTPGFRARRDGTAAASAADLWLSRRETRRRETDVPHNAFVFNEAPATAGSDDRDPEMTSGAAQSGDACRLRTGDAMMASEGVAATFFYRLLANSDPAMRARRLDRLIHVLAHIGRWPTRAPLVTLVQTWRATYPNEGAQIVRLFLDTTYGATASDAAAAAANRLACLGARGKLQAFVPALKAYRATMDALAAQVLAGKLTLDAALGPGLWLARPDITVPRQPWSELRELPLVVDLNTTDEATLGRLLGDRVLARRLLAERRRGSFASLVDAAGRAGLDAAQQQHLEQLAQQFAALPLYTRQ